VLNGSPPDLIAVFYTASMEAHQRRHALVSVDHFVWVLLAIRDVTALPEARDPTAARLREGVASRLARIPCDGAVEVPTPSDEALRAFRKALVAMKGSVALSALAAMAGALASEGTGPEFEAMARWAVEPADRRDPAATCHLVFWNDDETKMEEVIDLLQGTVVGGETEAHYLMWLVHRAGCAVVRSGPREAIEVLAAQVTRAAQERALRRLRTTVEDRLPAFGLANAGGSARALVVSSWRPVSFWGHVAIVAVSPISFLFAAGRWDDFSKFANFGADEARRALTLSSDAPGHLVNAFVAAAGIGIAITHLVLCGYAAVRLGTRRDLRLWAVYLWSATMVATYLQGWLLSVVNGHFASVR
jgi:ATP-dependent Clp protease adapter protein ClpS